jgi:hypothetical protein
MLEQINDASRMTLQRVLDAADIHIEPEHVPLNNTKDEIAALLGGMLGACERAVQALRDVRHLLPPDGVAIVDAVLDCAT